MDAELDADLAREEEGDSFPVEAVVIRASRSSTGKLRLAICLDPEQPEDVARGRYTGAIQITGPQVQPTAIPLEVTLKASVWAAVLWSAVGVLVGIVLKAFADLRRTPNEEPSWSEFRKHLMQPWVVIAILVGAVAALIALYTSYDADDAWGTTQDRAELLIGAVVVQVTGMTVVDLFHPSPNSGIGRQTD